MSSSNQLNRSLGLGLVVIMVVGNILGSGIYKKVAPMAAELHSSGWVLICWVLGGIISLFGALSNAEIASMLADTGGEYVYYKKIYNRFFAFLFGWSLFSVIQTAAISSLAYLCAHSLNSIYPLPELLGSWKNFTLGGLFYPFEDFNVKLTAILLIIVLTWLNSRGLKIGAGFSTIVLMIITLSILLIVAFGFSSVASAPAKIFDLNTTTGKQVSFAGVSAAMLAAFWAYQGWASTGYIGGEIKNAHRNLPLGITIGIFIVIGLYLLVNATYLSILPINQLEAIHQSGNQIAAVEASRVFGGGQAALLVSILVCVTTLSATHATILVSCRMYYAMAREGLFFKGVEKLNKAHVPARSMVYQGVWACVLVLSGSFDQLTDMVIFSVFLFYGATALGVFILRRKMPHASRPYKVWGYPVVPAIVVLFSATLFISTVYSRPREAAIGTVLMLTGVPIYAWFRRSRR